MSPSIEEQSSTYGPAVIALYQTLQSYGVDADALLARAGIETGTLNDPTARITSSSMERLIREAIDETGDPCLGIRYAAYVHPTSFHALGLALLSSATLRAFCRRLERYYAFITTNEVVEFEDETGTPRLIFQSRLATTDASVMRLSIEASMATMVRFIRFMYRPDYAPTLVELSSEEVPERRSDYVEAFGENVVFSSALDAIHFDPGLIDQPLPAANAELARQNDEVVVAFLAKMRAHDIPTRVQAKLIELLPSGNCSKEKVARSLGMSVRALHNRLADTGTSYQSLLDLTRRDLAEQYMRQGNLLVSEIAYLLGFSDGSNFSRAFQRWTGVSPREFRESLERIFDRSEGSTKRE